ncbi:MAG TPA: isochorismate synthase [Acidimicrobiales bacterium]|nr:isochorismate synthase [Acidimicrobiales bacterium]
MTRSPDHVVALRLPLDTGPPIDPFALAGADGILFHTADRALVGLGNALSVALPHGLDSPADLDRATAALASIPCEDRSDPTGPGVIGFGALPFDRSEPASLVVPEVTYGADASGQEWVTLVAADRADLPSGPAGLRSWLRARSAGGLTPTGAAPAPPSIDPLSSDESFEAMVAEALESIGRGELAKVVLARQVDVTLGRTIDTGGLLRRWHHLEPSCAVFALPTADGRFVGASPELLVDRSGSRVHSRPLAGTTDHLTGGPDSVLPRELLRSPKDGNEHRLVVEAIVAALAPLCAELDVPSRPDLVRLHNLTHLGTSVTGTLAPAPDGRLPSALHLVAALHPTPAVGGVPTAEARLLIDRLEPRSRGNYAGPVGYVDAGGDGRWELGIRSMTISGSTARLTAGVGIVAGSEPSTELVEATLKFTAVFDALAPGRPFSTSQGPGRRQAVR